MNLMICSTPLQMLICEKILSKLKLKEIVLIVIAYNDNNKFRYYYDRLSKSCNHSYFLLIDKSTECKRFKALCRLTYFWINLKIKFPIFDRCFLSSIDSPYIQAITSNINYKELYTFDDGTINIQRDSDFYIYNEYSFLKRMVRKAFNITDNIIFYKDSSIQHYTIFKDLKNIIENTEHISLGNIDEFDKNRTGIMRIFVGQPLDEIGLNKDVLLNVLHKNKIDLYFPHPREESRYDNINYITTHYLFEEYISECLLSSDTNLEVYTFFSTAIINVKDIDNVSVYSIFHRDILDKFISVYELFKRVNIPVITFNNETKI